MALKRRMARCWLRRGSKNSRRSVYIPPGQSEEGTRIVPTTLPFTHRSQSPLRLTTAREEFNPVPCIPCPQCVSQESCLPALDRCLRGHRKHGQRWLLSLEPTADSGQSRPFNRNRIEQQLVVLPGGILDEQQRPLGIRSLRIEPARVLNPVGLCNLVSMPQWDFLLAPVGKLQRVAARFVAVSSRGGKSACESNLAQNVEPVAALIHRDYSFRVLGRHHNRPHMLMDHRHLK